MYGYVGKILRIDLSRKQIKEEELNEGFARKYIGGRGFGVKILYSEVPEEIDSFSEDNKIIFSVGPFEGTNLPGSARTCIVTKSPLSGYLGDTDFEVIGEENSRWQALTV